MGDAEGDHIADAKRASGRYGEMAVLVVQSSHHMILLHGLNVGNRRSFFCPEPFERPRKGGIKRDIALSHREDGLSRLGPRLYRNPAYATSPIAASSAIPRTET